MAGSIKGIIVEIGGDTSGLQRALSKVNSATASLSKELKGINSLLKLDPKNTELLKQKQDILTKSINETRNSLTTLKEAKEEYDKRMAEGTKINEENYRYLQREIINTEAKLKQLELSSDPFYKMGQKAEEFGNKINTISDKINSLGNKLTTRLSLPIAAVVGSGLNYNAEIEKMTTAYSTFLGDAKEADKVVTQIKNNASKTPFDATSLIKANQMLISTGENADASQKTIMALGDAITATGGGNDELTRMASNLQQIKNAGKATAMDIRQFAYAGIDVYGLLADYTGKTTEEVKDMEISYEDLSGALQKASQNGGKYYDAMNKASETLAGQTKQLKAQFKDMTGELTKSLMPVAKKIVNKASDLINKFDKLSDSEKENILKIGLMVAAAGPLLKVLGTLGNTVGTTVKGFGTFAQAVGVMANKTTSANETVNKLAKVLQGLSSPLGIAALGITAAVGIIIAEVEKAKKETESKFKAMADGVNSFVDGVENAKGYLSDFNTTLFATTEEQEELQKQMDEIQEGITKICKTASDERRGYTQEEITQLDEYFNKLRELKNREIEIEQLRADAIKQQAKTIAETNEGSLAEYQEVSNQWIATTQQQTNEIISKIESATIEEIALLNQRYGTEANMQNQAYADEYNRLMEQKEEKIKVANQEVAEVTSAFAEGYSARLTQEDGYLNTIKEYTDKQQKLLDGHNEQIKKIKDGELWYVTNTAQAIDSENETFAFHQKELYKEMYKNMSEEQAKELGVWLAKLSQTELYGGEISKENQEMVDTIINSYDEMPDDAKKAMTDTMSGMLKGMEDKQPTLFAKATGIADGILSRLKKSFDIHSPSKETRDIFQNVMKGAELGLEDERKRLNKQVDTIASQMKTNFANIMPNMAAIKQSVIDQTRTVFTTPNITFNVQKMDEANLNKAFNYINRRLGSQY